MVPVFSVLILQFKLVQDGVSLRALIRSLPEKKERTKE